MRHRRLIVVLAITAGAWAPRDAAASCEAIGPYLGTGPQLPLGCPVHVYGMPPIGQPFIARITAIRNGSYVDVTGQVNQQVESLNVARTFVDCRNQIVSMMTFPELFNHFSIVPMGVTVGERVGFGMGWFGGIEIVAAGPCAAPIVPMPACIGTNMVCGTPQPPIFDEGSDDCSVGGGGSLAIGLALLGLLRRPSRRR